MEVTPKINKSNAGNTSSWPPNWTEETEYRAESQLSPVQWAWEFLRRNKDYQASMDKLVKKFEGTNELEKAKEIKLNRRLGGALRIRNPQDANEALEDIAIEFNEKFGLLTFPANPSEQDPALRFESVSIFTRGTIKGEFQLDEDQVLCLIDFRISIDDQIKILGKKLKSMVSQPPNRNGLKGKSAVAYKVGKKDLYKAYLRILDASTHGASDDEIAKELYPKEPNDYPEYTVRHKVYEQRLAAERLTRTAHTFLPFKNK